MDDAVTIALGGVFSQKNS